jgi:hypothetical protein
MNNLKFKKNSTTGAIHAFLNGAQYRPYLIGELPNTFAFIHNENEDQDGITEWFNLKGLTYVRV